MTNIHLPRPTFDASINWGQIGVIISVLASGVGVYSSMSADIEAGRHARARYIPIIEALVERTSDNDKTNSLQDERLLNIGTAIQSMREADIRTTEALGKIALDIAVVKAILDPPDIDKRSGAKLP